LNCTVDYNLPLDSPIKEQQILHKLKNGNKMLRIAGCKNFLTLLDRANDTFENDK